MLYAAYSMAVAHAVSESLQIFRCKFFTLAKSVLTCKGWGLREGPSETRAAMHCYGHSLACAYDCNVWTSVIKIRYIAVLFLPFLDFIFFLFPFRFVVQFTPRVVIHAYVKLRELPRLARLVLCHLYRILFLVSTLSDILLKDLPLFSLASYFIQLSSDMSGRVEKTTATRTRETLDKT